MLQTLIQASFAAGEISPEVQGRTDIAKYRMGVALARNMFVLPYGGLATRPGTAICGRVKQPYGIKPRNIDFTYSTLQTYTLEFGNHYMRVLFGGGYVLEPAQAIGAISQAAPGVFTIGSTPSWSVGDQVFVFGAVGMVAVNSTPGFQLLVASTDGAGHFTFTDLDGHALNTALMPAYAGGGSAARIFTLTTPFAVADLPLLKYTQNTDTMTLNHNAYGSYNLTRTQHWAWTLTAETFQAAVQAPTGLSGADVNNPGGTQTTRYYLVTSLTDVPNEESVPAGPVAVANGPLNQNTGVSNNLNFAAPATGPAPARYNIYCSAPAGTGGNTPTLYGYIGQTTSLAFNDANFAPDYTTCPPSHQNPFAGGNNPGTSSYFDGRKVYAAPAQNPTTLYLTQPGNFGNMDVSVPVQADDAITITLTSRQVNAIKHLISLNALLALTSSGAWMITPGSTSDSLTPSSAVAKAQAYNGASDVPPLTVNNDILYVQARGSKVRDLTYNFYVNLYTGNDISVLASHLLYGYTIAEWTYCEEPYYQILAVRNDGQMLSFTFLKEQDVYAWTHYDTFGNSGTDSFQSICSIAEGAENRAYVVTARTIPGVNGGNPVYYQERFASRNFYVNGKADVRQAWCVDCGVQYSGAATAVITGLQHLEGCTVAVLADGGVQAPRVVAGGQITLDHACALVTVGLPYVCQMQTLRLDRGEPSIQGKRKKISRVTLLLKDALNIKYANMTQNSSGDLVIGNLFAMKDRSSEPFGTPTALKTGVRSFVMEAMYQIDGSMFFQMDTPTPATFLACIPTVTIGDD